MIEQLIKQTVCSNIQLDLGLPQFLVPRVIRTWLTWLEELAKGIILFPNEKV